MDKIFCVSEIIFSFNALSQQIGDELRWITIYENQAWIQVY